VKNDPKKHDLRRIKEQSRARRASTRELAFAAGGPCVVAWRWLVSCALHGLRLHLDVPPQIGASRTCDESLRSTDRVFPERRDDYLVDALVLDGSARPCTGSGWRSEPWASIPAPRRARAAAAGVGIRMAGIWRSLCGQTIMKLAGEWAAGPDLVEQRAASTVCWRSRARLLAPSLSRSTTTCSTGCHRRPCGSVDDVRRIQPDSARDGWRLRSRPRAGSSWRSHP